MFLAIKQRVCGGLRPFNANVVFRSTQRGESSTSLASHMGNKLAQDLSERIAIVIWYNG